MACMEHNCRDCPWSLMDNNTYTICPNCKGTNIISYFDEATDPQEDEDIEEDDDL